MAEKPQVLVLEDDIMFSVRLESVLKKSGYAPLMARSFEQALQLAESTSLVLSIVSFGRAHLRPLEAVTRLKALTKTSPVIGFLSHTQIPQVRPDAKAAGCDLLVPNSSITMRLPQLMARLAPLDGAVIDMDSAQVIAEEEE